MRYGAVIALVALAILGLVLFWGSGQESGQGARAAHAQAAEGPTASAAPKSSPRPAATGATAADAPGSQERAALVAQLRDRARALLKKLRAKGASPDEVRKSLGDLKASTHEADPSDAAEALIGLLRSGEDAATGLGFFVGAEGVMSETPTYRTALLDLLGQTDPALASAYAREVMDTTTSSDEYALALRNLAWANHDSELDQELRDRLQQMLSRAEWQSDPSKGYLEAFDVAVATGATSEMFGQIQAETGGQESAASRAAFVALDRMMLANPSSVLGALSADPSLLAQSPYHRASLVSRADVRDAAQAQFLEQYLLDPSVTAKELSYFAQVFPNGNRFSSNRLVTDQESGGSIDQVATGDRATLDTVRAWMSRPEFSARQETLARIAARLEGFLQPAEPK